MPGPARTEGVLVDWNDTRGFGFIEPLDGGPRTFVHISAFGSTQRRPQAGEVVDYELSTGRDGRPVAVSVRRAADAVPGDATPRPRPGVNWLVLIPVLGLAGFLAVAVLSRGASGWIVAIYVVMSVLTYLLYVRDKQAAIAGRWRVSEATLQTAALACGWPGAVLAQQLLRHKNRKASFQIGFWLVVILNVAALAITTLRPDLVAAVPSLVAKLGA